MVSETNKTSHTKTLKSFFLWLNILELIKEKDVFFGEDWT